MNLHTRDLRQNHDPEKEKMKVLERCIMKQDPVLLSAEIERLRPANINALIPQCRIDEVLSIGSSLLRVPIANCLYDLIVVLLRHGANPLLPVNQTSDTYSGEDIRTTSGLFLCTMYAYHHPDQFVFLLRLLDWRAPEAELEEMPCFNMQEDEQAIVHSYDYLGRYVDAPLTVHNFDNDRRRASRTALMYACERSRELCVDWLLKERGADPRVELTDERGNKFTALSIALKMLEEALAGTESKNSCLRIVKMLLDHDLIRGSDHRSFEERLATF